jgi:hypothetical protein
MALAGGFGPGTRVYGIDDGQTLTLLRRETWSRPRYMIYAVVTDSRPELASFSLPRRLLNCHNAASRCSRGSGNGRG